MTDVVYLVCAQYEGTFEDYLEMFIQFGYVTLFSCAYPLAGFWALANNVWEIRGDAFKMCFVHQRPFGHRANSIGIWQVTNHTDRYHLCARTGFPPFCIYRLQWRRWV